MQKSKKRIGTRLVINSFLFSLLLSLCIGLVGFLTYYAGVMERYQVYLETAINYAFKNLDSDDIARCLLTGEKSEKYYALQESMNIFKDSSHLEYFYIIKPLHTGELDNVEYVLTAVNQTEIDNNDKEISLGDLSDKEYSSKVVQNFFDYMQHDGISYYPNRTKFGYMYSAVAPVKDSSGQTIALAVAEISMDTVLATMHGYVLVVLLSSVIVTALFLAVQIKWMRRRVVNPIAGLANAAEAYVHNKLSSEGSELVMNLPDINTQDELELLHNALRQMSIDINDYMRNLTAVTAEKERIGVELNVAKHIQSSMLPNIFPAFPDLKQVDVYASMLPAKEVGGDFYDFFLADKDHLVLVMADVSGKGVAAALFMVIAKTLIKNVAQTGISPKEVLTKVNEQLCINNEADMFVTVWLGILEISTGKMVCANAGHEYPVIKHGNGDYELIKDKHGFVLAGFESSKYTEYELQLCSGDKLYLYTDGVPEATNASSELYGNERMLNVLNKNKNVDCKELLIRVKEDVDAFVDGAPQFDDITMLSLEYFADSEDSHNWSGQPTSAAIEQMCAIAEKELEACDASMKVVTQINIVIDEIFSNIIKHSSAAHATFDLSIGNKTITLKFTDNGKSYDPLQAPDPDITLSANERKIGGLGVFMVKKTMTSLAYERKNDENILTITKDF